MCWGGSAVLFLTRKTLFDPPLVKRGGPVECGASLAQKIFVKKNANVEQRQLLWRGLYSRDTSKLRKKLGQVISVAAEHLSSVVNEAEFTDRDAGQALIRFGGSLYQVSLRGMFSDGPHCTCTARESTLCIHIMIAILSHAYTFEELQAFGFNGLGLDMLFKTFADQMMLRSRIMAI